MSAMIDSRAVVEEGATLGSNVKVWHWAHVRKGASLGANTIVGKSAFIDSDVRMGENCKIQNNASIYHGAELGAGVFVGPHVCITNDRYPRAITADGHLKTAADWQVIRTIVGTGASIGAQSTIVAGVTLGEWCLIGAGSLVTKSIPPFALAYGSPARIAGIVGYDGKMISSAYKAGTYRCSSSGKTIEIRPEWVR